MPGGHWPLTLAMAACRERCRVGRRPPCKLSVCRGTCNLHKAFIRSAARAACCAGQVGGHVIVYGPPAWGHGGKGLTYATVRGAGHVRGCLAMHCCAACAMAATWWPPAVYMLVHARAACERHLSGAVLRRWCLILHQRGPSRCSAGGSLALAWPDACAPVRLCALCILYLGSDQATCGVAAAAVCCKGVHACVACTAPCSSAAVWHMAVHALLAVKPVLSQPMFLRKQVLPLPGALGCPHAAGQSSDLSTSAKAKGVNLYPSPW